MPRFRMFPWTMNTAKIFKKSRTVGFFTVLAPLTLTENATSLPRIVALTILLATFSLPALAPLPHLLQLHAQVEHGGYGLHILREGPGVAREGIEDGLLMDVILGHVAAVPAVAVLAAEDLEVETLAVHLEALRFAAVAADFLHFLDFVETLPLLRTTPHFPPLLAQQLSPGLRRRLHRVFFHFGVLLLHLEGLGRQGQWGEHHSFLVGREFGDGGFAVGQFPSRTGGVQHLLREEGVTMGGVRKQLLIRFFLHPEVLLLDAGVGEEVGKFLAGHVVLHH